MIKTVLALLATVALLWPISVHAESNGLTDKDVIAAMNSNSQLIGKTYGRVDYHVLDDEGNIVHVESIFPAQMAILSYPIGLPSGQRCKTMTPRYRIPGGAVWVYWCDPGNHNKLQSDIYQMNFDGSEGGYKTSFKEIDCVTEKPNIPYDPVYLGLCPHD